MHRGTIKNSKTITSKVQPPVAPASCSCSCSWILQPCSFPLESLNIKTKSSMGAFIGWWGSKVTYQSGEACTIISVYCFCCCILCIWISMVTMVSTYLVNIVRSPARPTAQHHILSATFIVLFPLCWDLRYSTAQNKEQCAWGLRVWSSTLPCLDHFLIFV